MSQDPSIPAGPDLRQQAAEEYPELAAPQGYQFPPGTPPVVPADFAAAREAALETQLTREEIAEFRALQAEKKERDRLAREEAAAAAARLAPAMHHVHLADGTVLEGSTIESHYAPAHGGLVPVTGAYLKAEYLTL
jgi:hypothetical protein